MYDEIFIDKFNHFGKKNNVLLVYPNKYKFGISNLGHQTVYRILNQNKNINCERLYLDDSKIKKHYSIETEHLISEYKIILFSICYENDILNIIEFLKNYNWFPLENKNRPILICGGSLTFINPKMLEIISDYVILGDIEDFSNEFIDFLNELNDNEKNKIDKSKYFFLNEFSRKKTEIFAYSSIISSISEFKNTFLIEIIRGCQNKCNFCVTGNNRTPLKILNKEKLLEKIKLLKKLNIKKIGFIGSSLLIYPNFKEILKYLIEEDFEFSLSSVELSKLDFEFLELIHNGGQHTLTIAPEVANFKMSKIINKKVDFEKLFSLLNFGVNIGLNRFKFYFLYGLPEETIDDLDDIVKLLLKLKKISSIKNKPVNIIASFNPFIPKMNTPFEKYDMESKSVLIKKQRYLKNLLKKTGIRLEFLSIKLSIIQYKIQILEGS